MLVVFLVLIVVVVAAAYRVHVSVIVKHVVGEFAVVQVVALVKLLGFVLVHAEQGGSCISGCGENT